MHAAQRRSMASKKGWRSRMRMAEARALALRQAQTPTPKPRRVKVGYASILAATTPHKTSTDIARELGLTSAYVRKVWARCGLPKRTQITKRQLSVCACNLEPAHDGVG